MKPTTILILIGLLTATILQAHGTTIYEEDFETGQLDPAHWMARPSLAGVAGLVDVADGTRQCLIRIDQDDALGKAGQTATADHETSVQ